MRTERFDLPLCIVVEEPVRGLALALLRGQAGRQEAGPHSRPCGSYCRVGRRSENRGSLLAPTSTSVDLSFRGS